MDISVDHMFTAAIETIASNFGVKNYAAATWRGTYLDDPTGRPIPASFIDSGCGPVCVATMCSVRVTLQPNLLHQSTNPLSVSNGPKIRNIHPMKLIACVAVPVGFY